MPREVAQPFQVARETLLDYDGLEWATESFFAQAEAKLLKACLENDVLWYGEFEGGSDEALIIIPVSS